jgi:(p)ppGpp synthase/HD superfamily hydrolase
MKTVCIKALSLAEKHYPKKKLQHAIRVAGYAVEIASRDSRKGLQKHLNEDYAFTVGILHDLVEDTEVRMEEIDYNFPIEIAEAVEILTKPDDVAYTDYIDNLLESENILAYWVKKADMKDHLSLKDTLTDRLKQKYLEGLAELL